MRYIFVHAYFIVSFVLLYFVEPGFLYTIMEKGILFVPNAFLVFIQILKIPSSRLESVVATSNNVVRYKSSEKIDMLALAARDESINLVERPGTKVAIGLTKPKKPRIDLGMQNKNVLV